LHQLPGLVDIGSGLEHHHDIRKPRNRLRANHVDALYAVEQVGFQRNGDHLLDFVRGEPQGFGLNFHVRRRELGEDVYGRIAELYDPHGHHAHRDGDDQHPEPQAHTDDRTNHC
jgi:hypothetical protein